MDIYLANENVSGRKYLKKIFGHLVLRKMRNPIFIKMVKFKSTDIIKCGKDEGQKDFLHFAEKVR